MGNRTVPYDLRAVPGYPDSLQIYRISASRFWQVRYFVGGKYARKTTGCEEEKAALEFAKAFFDNIKISQRLDFHVHKETFQACAQLLLKRQESLISQGERSDRINAEDRKKLDKDLLPYFGTMGVESITTAIIDDYIQDLTSGRKLSASTRSKHLVVISKVLNEARKRGFIRYLPPFPAIRRKDNPRPYFTRDEYTELVKVVKDLKTQGIKVRYVPLDEEIYDFIIFHVNVFVRPSDLKLLKHKHVSVVDEGGPKGQRYVSIIPTNSKTVIRESVSMPTAVAIYQRLKKRHGEEGLAGKDDYVFFPQYRNRATALATIRRQFDYVLKVAGLKEDRFGRSRTIYSLRHTALMFRILLGKNVDIYVLAKNALTSVDQLERFYLSHVETTQKVKSLQSLA